MGCAVARAYIVYRNVGTVNTKASRLVDITTALCYTKDREADAPFPVTLWTK